MSNAKTWHESIYYINNIFFCTIFLDQCFTIKRNQPKLISSSPHPKTDYPKQKHIQQIHAAHTAFRTIQGKHLCIDHRGVMQLPAHKHGIWK